MYAPMLTLLLTLYFEIAETGSASGLRRSQNMAGERNGTALPRRNWFLIYFKVEILCNYI